jgi:hypothetical protein
MQQDYSLPFGDILSNLGNNVRSGDSGSSTDFYY